MKFFSVADPAATVQVDLVNSTTISPKPRRTIRKSKSIDESTPPLNRSATTRSPKKSPTKSPHRQSRQSRTTRGQQPQLGGMDEHLEGIEAFCSVLKEASVEDREMMMKQYMPPPTNSKSKKKGPGFKRSMTAA